MALFRAIRCVVPWTSTPIERCKRSLYSSSLSSARTLSLLSNYTHHLNPVTCPPRLGCLSLSAGVHTKREEDHHLVLPPNLKFDPRCISTPFYGLEEVHAKTDADDEKEVEEAKELSIGNGDEKSSNIDDESDDIISEEDHSGSQSDTMRIFDINTRPNPPRAIPLPQRLHVPIHHFPTAEEIGTIHLSESIFGLEPIREDLIHRAVVYIRNKRRGKRTARSKTISEVSGSGRKVRPQKGQGRARAGHRRPPHWRGGARAHGPKGTVQDYTTKLNKKVRRLSLKHAFSQKLLEGNMTIVGTFDLDTYKTKDVGKMFDLFDVSGRYGTSAFVLDHVDSVDDSEQKNSEEEENSKDVMGGCNAYFKVGSKNLPKIKVVNQLKANVYDLLKHEKLFISLKALQALEKRLED